PCLLYSLLKEKRQKEAAKQDIRKVRGPDGQPIYLTKENVTKIYGEYEGSKIELFEQLEKSFTKEQRHQMNSAGYAVLSPAQRELIYGPNSPMNDSIALDRMRNVTNDVVHRTVRDTIRFVGAGELRYEVHDGVGKLAPVVSRRQKRQARVLNPLVLQAIVNDPAGASAPLILSPVVLSALINSPAVFGAIVLSPFVFLPLITSPRVLSPIILTPAIGTPIILSPLVLDPFVLSPGVMNPFVLSPFVLTPLILSPQALTPLILSPFVLSPLVGTPNALSPLVLSPFAASPLVYSTPILSALVLSPHFLSPNIHSQGIAFTSVLSPAYLS
ncbi:unnamed protein product, partial [Strongylus vulgaris]